MNKKEAISVVQTILRNCKKHAYCGLIPGLVNISTGERYGEDLRDREKLEDHEYSLLASAEYGRACERLGFILLSEGNIINGPAWLKEADKTKQSILDMTENLLSHPNILGRSDQYNKLDDNIMKNVARWLVEDNIEVGRSVASIQHDDGGFPLRFKAFQYEFGREGPSDRANGKDGEGRYACQVLLAAGMYREAREWAEWSLSVQHPNAGWAERFDEDGAPMKARGWEPGIIQSGFKQGRTALSVIATVHHVIALIDVYEKACLDVHDDLKKRIKEAVRRAMVFITMTQREDGKWNRFFVYENRQYTPIYVGKSQTSYSSPQDVASANDEPPGQVYRRDSEGVIIDQWHNNFSSQVGDYYYSFRIQDLFEPINDWLQGKEFVYPQPVAKNLENTILSNLDRFYSEETGLFHHISSKPNIVKFAQMLQTINRHFLTYVEIS